MLAAACLSHSQSRGDRASCTQGSRVDVTITLPKDVALAQAAGQIVGGHTVAIEGRTVTVSPAGDATHIELVLRDLLLRALGRDAPAWALPLRDTLRRMGDEALMIVDGPTISDPDMVDRYIFTGDLSHRMLFERRLAGRPGRPALWLLAETGSGDLAQPHDGPIEGGPKRSSLAQLMAPTLRWMEDGSVADDLDGVVIVNIHTARSGPVAPRGLYQPPTRDTLPSGDAFIARAAKGAAIAIGAWGTVKDDYQAQRITQIVADAGLVMHGLVTQRSSGEVRWLTATSPAQPRMPRALSAESRPVPLEELRNDRSRPLP